MLKNLFPFLLLLLSLGLESNHANCENLANRTSSPARFFRWIENEHALGLKNGEKVVWQFNYGKEEEKPYFSPLALLDGTDLGWIHPADHPWHLSLWFSWKFINGVNYWEPSRETNKLEGITEPMAAKVIPHPDFSAQVTLELTYHPPGELPLMSQSRKLEISVPDSAGAYRIDWESTFSAKNQDVELSRTPIPGETGGAAWGGYAGLSMRLSSQLQQWQVLNGDGKQQMEGHGQQSRWMDFSGSLPSGAQAGVAIFDCTQLGGQWSHWYIAMQPEVPFAYFSPAPLFQHSYTLPAGKTLQMKYRILIHPERLPPGQLEQEWQDSWKKIIP